MPKGYPVALEKMGSFTSRVGRPMREGTVRWPSPLAPRNNLHWSRRLHSFRLMFCAAAARKNCSRTNLMRRKRKRRSPI